MRVKRELKPIEVKCIDCPKVFIAYSKKAKRCPVCRKIKARAQSKKCMEYLREYRKAPSKKETLFRPKLTIGEVLRELEIYNKANGTHLSYGQFMVLLEKGA